MANMKDGPVGNDGMKAKILCQFHNAKLSPLDDEAKKLAEGLHHFVDGARYTSVQVNGLLLERWALKTLINFVTARLAHASRWLPDEDAVRIAFGMKPMPSRCGLYLLRLDGYRPISLEQSGVTPVWKGTPEKDPQELMGGIVYLHGAAFFLLLNPMFLHDLRKYGIELSMSQLTLSYDHLTYHPTHGVISNDRGHTMDVAFNWA